MKKIVLLCAQGMSTGMLMNKMRECAAKIGYECTINAYSVSRAKEMASDADASSSDRRYATSRTMSKKHARVCRFRSSTW